MTLPGEFGAGRSVSGAIAYVEQTPKSSDGDFTIGGAFEGDVGFLGIDEVIPQIGLDDPPAAGKGFGEARRLGHQLVSAKSFGKPGSSRSSWSTTFAPN